MTTTTKKIRVEHSINFHPANTRPALVIMAAGRARRYGAIKPLAPVGLNGEVLIDLIAQEALTAGFREFVIVVNEQSGPVIAEHIRRRWWSKLSVTLVIQSTTNGTMGAVLAAKQALLPGRCFAVANADDLYGVHAMTSLFEHLRDERTSAVVGYQIGNAVVGERPVNRGTCEVTNGRLSNVVERRGVRKVGGAFLVDDCQAPETLSGDTIVSMNLWGFKYDVFKTMKAAYDAHDFTAAEEFNLPEFVNANLDGALDVKVLETTSRCIGVTHPQDLAEVQNILNPNAVVVAPVVARIEVVTTAENAPAVEIKSGLVLV
jgi:NDP-sugar pyrophosphorylase family protein